MDDGNWRKTWRSFGMAMVMLMPSLTMAQIKQPAGYARIVADSEAKHLRSRQNLFKILSEHPQFWPELLAAAERLKTQPAWLLNVMATESLFDPAARNSLPGQSASGLLQFVENTALRLGTTTTNIRQMNPVQQLLFVEMYFAPFRGRLNSMADIYMAVFRGFIVDGKGETVISPLSNSRKEQRIYKLNKWLDLNNDQKITKGELALAATLIGRFQPQDPALPRPGRELRPTMHLSSATSDRKPSQTRSIYIRLPKPIK